jgi:endonuclease/exonuclease/phosphatase family metal-dependent hydrolase
MLNRRGFLGIAAAGLLAADHGTRAAEESKTWRTISYNVLAFRGYPNLRRTRERLKEHRDRHPELTAEALAVFLPDIVTLQEGPEETRAKRFAQALGMQYAFFPGGWEGDLAYPGGFPGVIASRYAIEESENRPSAGEPHDEALFTRHLGRAKLSTPFGPLHVISTHFHASNHPVRMREAAAIIALIAKLHESAPVLLQGDLNHTPDDPEYALWVEAGLMDIGKATGTASEPTSSSVRPTKRIDYVWATPELAKTARKSAVLNKPPFIPEPDDRSSYALSDHLPVMAEFGFQEG